MLYIMRQMSSKVYAWSVRTVVLSGCGDGFHFQGPVPSDSTKRLRTITIKAG